MKIVCNIHFTETNDVDLDNPNLDVFGDSDVDQVQDNGDGRNQLPSNSNNEQAELANQKVGTDKKIKNGWFKKTFKDAFAYLQIKLLHR